MSHVLPEGQYRCPRCQRKVHRLYPLTDYAPEVGRWLPMSVCLACCGPSGKESDFSVNPFRVRAVQR